MEKNSVKAAIELLSGYFDTINSRGPMGVVNEEGTTSQDYRAFIQQDAFQRVQTLLKLLA